jgi:hypothetical protein
VKTASPIFNTVWPFAILIVQVICWRTGYNGFAIWALFKIPSWWLTLFRCSLRQFLHGGNTSRSIFVEASNVSPVEQHFSADGGFTCLLYVGKEVSCVNDLRYYKIRRKCCSTGETFDASKNIDLGVLPPCRNCLREHLKRVNYQRALWNWGDFCNVLIGLTFPIPLNALVVSQRVNACRPKSAVHNS